MIALLVVAALLFVFGFLPWLTAQEMAQEIRDAAVEAARKAALEVLSPNGASPAPGPTGHMTNQKPQ